MRKAICVETSIGKLALIEEAGWITKVNLNGDTEEAVLEETPLLLMAKKQLNEYLKKERSEFDLPLLAMGTEFEKRVWDVLKQIPYGTLVSYKAVAEAIGSPKACRAVGRACNRNPLAVFIPCHRVIGKTGKLTGFAGGLTMKKALIELEKPTTR